MGSILEADFIRRTLKATIITVLLTLVTCYALWVQSGCDPWLPFISDTDVNPKSGVPFTIGFSIAGLLLTLGAVQLGLLRDRFLLGNDTSPSLIWSNRIAILPGAFAGVALTWLAFTPWHQQMELHIAQAMVIFYGGVIWAALVTFVTWRLAAAEPAFRSLLYPRVVACFVAIAGLILMMVTIGQFVTTASDFSAMDDYLMRVQTCTDLGSPLLARAAFFEWSMVLGMVVVLATFLPEVSILTSSTQADDSEE